MIRSPIPTTCTCPRSTHTHGTVNMYVTHRCGCPDCRAAHATSAARRRRQIAYGRHQAVKVDATGTRRRLQALMVVGWSNEAVGRKLGITGRGLHAVASGKQQTVTRANRDRIAALYDQLWDTPPPEYDRGSRVSAQRARRHAARNGYHSPMWWDDDIIEEAA